MSITGKLELHELTDAQLLEMARRYRDKIKDLQEQLEQRDAIVSAAIALSSELEQWTRPEDFIGFSELNEALAKHKDDYNVEALNNQPIKDNTHGE